MVLLFSYFFHYCSVVISEQLQRLWELCIQKSELDCGFCTPEPKSVLFWSHPHSDTRVAFLGASHPNWPLKRASKVYTLSGKFSQLPLYTRTEFGSSFPSVCIKMYLSTQIRICFA